MSSTICHSLYKDHSPPGSSVHEILQARILERVAMPSSREPSWTRDWTLVSCVSCIGRQVLYHYCHVGSPCSLQSTFIHLISFVLFNHLGCFWTMLLGKPLESLGLQGDQTSQSWRKSILNIHWKDWCWSCYTLATWYEEQTHQKRPDAGKD